MPSENVTHAFMYAARAASKNQYPDDCPEREAWALGRAFYYEHLDYPDSVIADEEGFSLKIDNRKELLRIPYHHESYTEIVNALRRRGILKTYGTAAKREAAERALPSNFEEPRPLIPQDNKIWTLSGQSFDLFTPPQEFKKYQKQFNIQDIATGLSHICRWGGQVNKFYSVAQHCCLTAMLCSDANKYYGLMHDTPEAYIDDMQRPLKQNFPEYRAVENILEPALLETFGLQGGKPPEVKFVDSCLAVAEANVLGLKKVFSEPMYADMVEAANNFFEAQGVKFTDVINPWSMDQAKKNFLKMFDNLKPDWLKVNSQGFVKTLPKKITEAIITFQSGM